MHFPDVNVLFALSVKEHRHHDIASLWWENATSQIVLIRQTQLGLLRLLTTAAAMNGRPLTMTQAWAVFDQLASDSRMQWMREPEGLEGSFRRHSGMAESSPKLWIDAYLQAVAESLGATLVTLDRALSERTPGALLLRG